MNISAVILSASLFAIALPTAALDRSAGHTDLARVTGVQPIYSQVQHRRPQEQCWVETVREQRPRRQSGTATLIGGIIGGVIGSEVGRGKSNKKIGSVVGSALGMSIANDISRGNRDDPRYRDIERCETTYRTEQQRVIQGYDVSYRYNNREYTTFMHEHPGKKIRVAVDVRPVTTQEFDY